MNGYIPMPVSVRCEAVLSQLHEQATQEVSGLDANEHLARLRAKLLLQALAQLTAAVPPPDPYARQLHTSLRTLINERMRPVTEGQPAWAWLLETLRGIDDTAVDNDCYNAWVKAAASTMTALLHASEPEALLPARSVYAFGERVRQNIASTLFSIQTLTPDAPH